MLFGWSGYFCHGTRRSAFRGIDHFIDEHARNFFARRHKVAGRGTRRFSSEVIDGKHRLLRLEHLP
jgi:RNA-directed DNA polymerase